MIFLPPIIFFILGLIIGSFLNVVICRFKARPLGGRSACMSCQSKLSWYELIPLFSFLSLGGRCRNCKTRISLQYPAVELATGLIFSLLFVKFSALGGQNIFLLFTPEFLITYFYYAVMFSILIVIAVYDLRHKIIPDLLSFIFGLMAFLGLFLFSDFLFFIHLPSLSDFLFGFFIALPFALFWLISSGRWMGLGDAKLAIGLGWFLGFPLALSGVVLAFWTGAVVGLYLIAVSSKYGMKSEIPFALYLTLGAFVAFFLDLHLFALWTN